MTKRTLSEMDLAMFTGSDEVYRHALSGLLYTQGIQYMAEHGGAYWLIDAIASYQRDRRITGNRELMEFQLWELAVRGSEAVLTCKADSDRDPTITQEIPLTDFPLSQITIYVENNTICLPSER
ncbi:MAG: hypothetical protein DWQ35_23130 [Planctomycetota bacterium]|nr:MAG: hypothetical protein DWQ35_23130 [Planctomycetota bacterium]REK23300.1 MAG: hypothetical protein DWQ42_15570 [Planctomycetota bacterium]REK39216.1 MAG: hypothetical protein DWQ46_18190 [Planctomycetota bacterium]